MQIAHAAMVKGRPPYEAFLYDDLQRRQWSRRAEKRDPGLAIAVECRLVDKVLMETVESRLSTVLTAAGMSGYGSQGAPTSPPKTSEKDREAATLLQKQISAAQEIQKKTSEAGQRMAREQQSMLDRAKAMMGFHQSAEAGPKGANGKGKTNKQLKTQAWFDKKQGHKGSSGSGGGNGSKWSGKWNR